MSVAAGTLGVTESILEGLNDEQRAAVTQEEGPLLIVAGAGTGKTAVITKRIAWLIATKRARPEEILALTFTEKAAAEMEARVDVLVPYGYTGATICTFHAFGDRLVRGFGVELGIASRLRVCTDAEVLVFLRERLFELELERYAPLGNPGRFLPSLLKVFSRARDEDVSPEAYAAFARRLAAEAGDDPALRDRATAEREKARAYARYRDLLPRHGRVDFGDQLSLALRIMRERAHVLRQLQDQYRTILVDEFQDTNHAQFEMLKLLAGTRRDVTVVGDDDQSIYRFRGAKLANLLGFLDAFPAARTVVLTRNYRSSQNLLDAAYQLIQCNDPDRLEAQLKAPGGARRFDKRLRAEIAGTGVIGHREFHTGSEEAEHVARTIADQVRTGRRRPGEFAILARRHSDLNPFLAALESAGLPFQQTNQSRLYERAEVQLCLAMLRAIADPDDSRALFHLLASPLFGADDVDLARLSSVAHRRNLSLRRMLERIEAEPLLHELTDATREAAARFLALARELARQATRRPTTDVLYAFVQDSGYLGQLTAEDSPEAEARIRNLAKLFTIARRIGEVLEENRVHAFVRHLDLLIEAGDDPAAAEVDVDLDAVQVITAHNAKGLEFPVVFMVGLAEGRFPLSSFARADDLPFPDELVHQPPTQGDARLEEERRLFYVGMTRAREELQLTWAIDYGGKSRRKMSRFVAEALGIKPSQGLRTPLSPREAIERHAPAPSAPAAVRPPLSPDEVLRLSSARIDDYLTCPLKYRYAHEVQIPLASDPRFMYGQAIHHAILVYYQHQLRGLPIRPEDVVRVFEQSWSSEGFISREHEERRLEQGRETLRRFVQREEASRVRPLQAEQTFEFRQGLNLVSGRWDRIDQRARGIVIVDFKTTDVEEDDNATQRATESLRGGQLGLYALAYRETRGVAPTEVELQFVGTGAVGRAPVADEHLAAAAERIAAAAAGIRGADFKPRPEFRSCRECPYNIFCPHSATRSSR
jgi:DNA helicase-2/ATP-dependent DNA helicase PcrA